MAQKRIKAKMLVLSLLLILTIVLAITKGSVNMRVAELLLQANRHILSLRLLRIFTAALAGAGLGVSGIALQAILKNPLAEPYILGTSSGAGLGAIIAIIMGLGAIYTPLASLIGAVLTIILVYMLAKQSNRIPAYSLILSGVIVSVSLSAVMVFLLSLSSNENLHGIMWWLWGNMQVYDPKLLGLTAILVISGICVIYVLAQDLNAISIGEEDALHLGINTEAVKKILFFTTSLITASLVSICGIIGFVGLIIPHIMRFIVGPNHKILIPATCLLSATFMILCDMLSRTVFSPAEIPIGVITAVIGAPVFIVLLRRKANIR